MANEYDWKAMREKKAFLALEDGTVFRGRSVGAKVDRVGEVVFNTGMCGYQEIQCRISSFDGTRPVHITLPSITTAGVAITPRDIISLKSVTFSTLAVIPAS